MAPTKDYLYFMRLNNPMPILVMLYPVLWSIFSAIPHLPSLKILVIFITGAIVMRTVGCILNDIADREFDNKVKRTMQRPLASGKIDTKSALSMGVILVLFAFILVVQLSLITIMLATFAMILIMIYPFFKRFFWIPQLMLGTAFNLGILMACSSLLNSLPISAWILYFSTIFWTISYDTIYASADEDDDLILNLHSSAIIFSKSIILFTASCQLLTITLLLIFGYMKNYNSIFYMCIFVVAGSFFLQCMHWKREKKGYYNKVFSDSNWVGLTILIGIILQEY